MKIKTVKKAPAVKAVVKKAATCAAKRCACKAQKPATKAVTFTVHAEKGKAVYVAGEFNDYSATVKLAPGDYQYKFVIDGTWCADPENVNAVANDQGTFNSVITVK